MNNLIKDPELTLNQIIEAFNKNTPDIFGNDQKEEARNYVHNISPSYLRTILDCTKLLKNSDGVVCELGAYLGIVSRSLKKIGYEVNPCDIPSYFGREEVKKYYRKSKIEIHDFNLREYNLPFKDASHDLVIACEIFEHLNFNPLPVFAEINRILKPNGYLYVGMPNSSSIIKRLKFLITGRHPSFEIQELFQQLDYDNNLIVGLHWREYSIKDTIEMVTPFGFSVEEKKLTSDTGSNNGNWLKRKLKSFVYSLPGCGHTQVVVFKKIKNNNLNLVVNPDS